MGDGDLAVSVGIDLGGFELGSKNIGLSSTFSGSVTFGKDGYSGPTFSGEASARGNLGPFSGSVGASLPSLEESRGLKAFGFGVTYKEDNLNDFKVSAFGLSIGVIAYPDKQYQGPDQYYSYAPGVGLVHTGSGSKPSLQAVNLAIEKAQTSVDLNAVEYNKYTTPIVRDYKIHSKINGPVARSTLVYSLADLMVKGGVSVINDAIPGKSLSQNALISDVTRTAARFAIERNLANDAIVRQAAGYEDASVVSGSMQPGKTGPQYGSDTRTGGTGYVGDHPGPGRPSGSGNSNTGNNPGNPSAPGYYGGGGNNPVGGAPATNGSPPSTGLGSPALGGVGGNFGLGEAPDNNGGISSGGGNGGGAAQSGQAANGGSGNGSSNTGGGGNHSGPSFENSGRGNGPSDKGGGGNHSGPSFENSGRGNGPSDKGGGGSHSTPHSGPQPILLDLDGNGVKITEYQNSTQFMTGKDGLQHRSSWAGAGDGVLFYDPDGRNAITESRQYVFTEWNPTAAGDLEALRSIWDSNGDGKLSAADTDFAKFKVLVTNADGSTTVMTLAQLGITEINLTANTVKIEFPDGTVITGQTTFTRSNGTKGTVANTTLVAETDGNRVVEAVSTDASGNRVLIQTGYDKDGGVAFKVTSVTSPTGSTSTRSYDKNGDGVTDFVQQIDKVTNANGTKVETVTNRVGADFATGILANRTVTTTSADGRTTTIERDSVGGGWFDQREVWIRNADGSRTEYLQELSQDGEAIHGRYVNVSANGLTRDESVDRDGKGAPETLESHLITIAADLSRTEITEIRNGNNSLRAKETETVSANGKVRSVASDLDGDGIVDRTDQMSITGAAGTATTSVATVRNGDNSVRASTTVVQSADALTKTTTADVDGDGDIDLRTVDQTVISADGSRVRDVTLTNTDNSVRSKVRETLGANKVTAETWVDQNQDGVFQATDLVKSVTVNTSTQARTESTWSRNADGSVKASSVAVTSVDGLTTNSTIDGDGDGDTDTNVSDVTTVASGVATRVVEIRNQDNSLRTRDVTTTSVNGLTVSQTRDIDGNGTIDARVSDVRVLSGDGSVTRTMSDFAGNGTTLTGRVTRVESADRRTVTVTTDRNGDGATDHVSNQVEAANGIKTLTETSYFANGAMAARSVTTTSATELVVNSTVDANGDGTIETVVSNRTVLNIDGSRTQTVDVNNGDGSDRAQTVSTTSDDGLIVTIQSDVNGDTLFDRTITSTKVLNANGSITETTQSRAQNNALLVQTQTTVSDDGLVIVSRSDGDGDGDFDLVRTDTISMLSDGGRTVTSELRTHTNVLRNKTTTNSTDDGRSITQLVDRNGDGQSDSLSTRVVANNGTITSTSSLLSATGGLHSRSQVVSSDDGLTVNQRSDRNGDGVYEHQTDTIKVLNANGSTTTTVTNMGVSGVVYSRAVVNVSDDGLISTRTDDLDGDGTTELTTATTAAIAQDGVRTTTVQTNSENNSLTGRSVTITSADRRTVTQSIDLDGNGTNDRSIVTNIADTGVSTTTKAYLSSGGALEARFVSTVSGDGFTTTTAHDTNGDGRADLSLIDKTVLSSSGGTTRSIVYSSERSPSIGRKEVTVNDDSTLSTVALDFNGDRQFEFTTQSSKVYAANGDLISSQTTTNRLGAVVSKTDVTTSGNGLNSSMATDFSGDGVVDRRIVHTGLADNSWVENSTLYSTGTTILETQRKSMSADGRTLTTIRDQGGDGTDDRFITAVTDLSQNLRVDYQDAGGQGIRGVIVTEQVSANNMLKSFTFDVESDLVGDFSRTTEIRFNLNGSSVESFSEVYSANSFNLGSSRPTKLVYNAATTREANGLQAVTRIDADGDGVNDATKTERTTIEVDGSRTLLSETKYANGLLRSRFETSVSADERVKRSIDDYDGNGIADKIIESKVLADGSTHLMEQSFTKGGIKNQTFITSTSADGLTTRINRGTHEQTIERSAIDQNSYTWSNGITASATAKNLVVSHQHDQFGGETWTMTTTLVGSNLQTSVSTNLQTSVNTVRLDATAKDRVIAEAARIFDTILDRDMDITERETLASKITNGQLDKTALATELLASTEFSTRYGTMTNAEFITQIYLNALGRAPAMAELNGYLNMLGTGVSHRPKFVIGISEGIEHTVVGNGHMSTSNFDVIMNPAEFDRSLDAVYVRTMVQDFVDVVYDRKATTQELTTLSQLLLTEADNPDDIVAKLLSVPGHIQGTATNSLYGLTGTNLIVQAYANALGRQPSAAELTAWTNQISSGRITEAQFIASLAQSLDHGSVGTTSAATTLPSITVRNGTSGNDNISGTSTHERINGLAGNDTLNGSDGSDALVGGTGNDSLNGGNGNDSYEWVTGDGTDVISDSGQAVFETDLLKLTNVSSSNVNLYRSWNSGDLRVAVTTSTGVSSEILVQNQFANPAVGVGIEGIQFSDGTIWSRADIEARAGMWGTSVADNIIGSASNDRIYGQDGNDTMTGNNGDDLLVGQNGTDSLAGGSGGDTYEWRHGHGNDTINDAGTSTREVDILNLANVSDSEVSLFRGSDSGNLRVAITPAGGSTTEILVLNQFLNATSGVGIEGIQFSNGTIWSRADIEARTASWGTSGADNYVGSTSDDRLFGLDGNDTLTGNDGFDLLVGGNGNDSLVGGNGNDTYQWTKGHGSDTINEAGVSLWEVDRLNLTNVASYDVDMTRANGSNNLSVRIKNSSGEVLTVLNRFASSTSGAGIEEISFSDGAIWTFQDILSRTRTNGTSAAETLNGTSYRDNLYGLAGNDTLVGGGGDDLLVGGAGNDVLSGGLGADEFHFADLLFQNDVITDFQDGIDRIWFAPAAADEFSDITITGNGSSSVTVSLGANSIVVNSVATIQLTVDDFLFV
jgi:hypothetical protein